MLLCHGYLGHNDKIRGMPRCTELTKTGTRFIRWTLVYMPRFNVCNGHWQHQNYRDFHEQLLRFALTQHQIFVVPTATLEEQSVHIRTVLRFVWETVGQAVYLEIIRHNVDGDCMTTRKILSGAGDETLSEEKP